MKRNFSQFRHGDNLKGETKPKQEKEVKDGGAGRPNDPAAIGPEGVHKVGEQVTDGPDEDMDEQALEH